MENKLDEIQKLVMMKKFSSFFKRIAEVYNHPSSTQDVVNHGIATKISMLYNPPGGALYSERYKISKYLSKIKFTAFFSSTVAQTNTDKKLYFAFKSPSQILKTQSSNTLYFIKYAIKRYCEETSSEKLLYIFNKTLSNELTPPEEDLRKTIYEISVSRSSLKRKIKSFFEGAESKKEVKISNRLKNDILTSKYKIIEFQTHEIEDSPETNIIKSCAEI